MKIGNENTIEFKLVFSRDLITTKTLITVNALQVAYRTKRNLFIGAVTRKKQNTNQDAPYESAQHHTVQTTNTQLPLSPH